MNRPDDVQVRPAGLDDAAPIAELEAEAFGAGAWTIQAVKSELCTANRRIAVADVGGRLVGYVAISVVAEVADLTRVAVTSVARRQGIGAALLAWAVEQSRIAGAERMILEVSAANEAAVGLYVSEGFAEIARRPGYYGGGLDALVLERPVRLGG